MKTPEDEAFDELAKKQGAWGGGFQAKKAMAVDKQEPVAMTITGKLGNTYLFTGDYSLRKGEKVYTAPTQRPWVGLTDAEIEAIYLQHHNQWCECESPNWGYERAIEQALKEKNFD